VTDRSADRNRDGRLVVFDGKGGTHAPGNVFGREGGRVWLVGAGPGDPELLTLKAARLLREADVVVHDRLIAEAILDLIPSRARRIYVGKKKSSHSVPQDGINDLITAMALEGLTVVRLKGGDPFIFGRGGEELLACRVAGVPCDVVPGVSAGLAAAASAGAPLTHRGLSQAVTFVTGHAAPTGDDAWGEPALDWAMLAKPNHTVVVYMGVSTAPVIAARLIAAGRSASTPVLIVENASRADERRIKATVQGMAEAAAQVSGPAVLIIGEVAALADTGQVAVDQLVDAAATAWRRA
jgi:uroporphyrin-III C-methyltransferase